MSKPGQMRWAGRALRKHRELARRDQHDGTAGTGCGLNAEGAVSSGRALTPAPLALGSKQYSAAIAFTLALFSHLVNHVNMRLQAELEDGENPVPALQSDGPGVWGSRAGRGGRTSRVGATFQLPDQPLSNTDEPEAKESLEKEDGPGAEPPPAAPQAGELRRSRKFSRLSCLRRRRHLPKAGDDSDLSEGFDSDSSRDSARASEGSDSGSDKSLEGGGTAFDAETDSEMNSQESRSDLEDMGDEEGTRSPALEPPRARPEAAEAVNGPVGPSEASIASSLRAMSTQMFQPKRCFRLAPSFSSLGLPPSEPRAPCVNGDVDKPADPGTGPRGLRPRVLSSSQPSCSPGFVPPPAPHLWVWGCLPARLPPQGRPRSHGS